MVCHEVLQESTKCPECKGGVLGQHELYLGCTDPVQSYARSFELYVLKLSFQMHSWGTCLLLTLFAFFVHKLFQDHIYMYFEVKFALLTTRRLG